MTYDLAGRLLNINTPTGPDDPSSGDYEYDYDSAGRLIEQSMPDGKTVGYELDDNGNRTQLIYPDGYHADYFYDELNRLADIKLNGSGTSALHFDYDDLSRRTQLTYENGCTCEYEYAINDDLTALNHAFVGSSVNFRYSCNKVHQAIGMSCSNKAFVWTPGASATTVYSAANNLNQYPAVAGAAYSYNQNGCLTGGPFTSASYDVLNRMTQVTAGSVTNDYIYDPTNRQAQMSSNDVLTGFLYDGQQMIEEYDEEGTLTNRYIRGNRLDEIFIKLAGYSTTYLHHDRLGSVIARTDNSGAVLNRYKYGIFGETASLTGTPFGYTGQRYDEEVALYNYKARVYAPVIGRFLQPDPIGIVGGVNLYSYSRNDCLNFTDPFGLTPGAGGGYKEQTSLLIGINIIQPPFFLVAQGNYSGNLNEPWPWDTNQNWSIKKTEMEPLDFSVRSGKWMGPNEEFEDPMTGRDIREEPITNPRAESPILVPMPVPYGTSGDYKGIWLQPTNPNESPVLMFPWELPPEVQTIPNHSPNWLDEY